MDITFTAEIFIKIAAVICRRCSSCARVSERAWRMAGVMTYYLESTSRREGKMAGEECRHKKPGEM